MPSTIRCAFAVLAVAVGLLTTSPPAKAVEAYNSNGFEPTRFIPGALAGPDVAGPWLGSGGTAPAVIQSPATPSGGQAVQFSRPVNGGDTWYGVNEEMP